MALKIESGQIQVRSVGGVPMQQVQPRGVEYIGPRAEAQSLGTMAQILDRMSDYAFGEAKRYRIDEGMQYAAQNPVTPQQLEAAKNGDVNSLVPSGNFSYFDQAVRKARSLELSSHFEVEGRNELAKLLSDIEAGTANSEQVSAKIATLTEGYGKTLAKVDGEAALKFRATMATHGNTVLNAAYSAELKRAKAQRLAKFDMDFDNSLKILQTTIEQHPDQIEAFADVFRKNTLTQSLLLGDAALQREYSTKFETALRNAKVQALTKHITAPEFLADPVGTMAKIRRGDIGTLSPVLQNLIANDFESVAKIQSNFMTAVSNNYSLAETKRKEEDRIKKDTALDLYEQFLDPKTSEAQKRTLRTQILELNVLSFDQTKSMFESAGANPGVVFRFEDMIDNGQITNSTELMAQGTRAGLSGQQMVELRRRMSTKVGSEEKALYRSLIGIVGDGPVVINKGSAEARAQQKLDDFLANEREKAVAEGKPFNRYDALLRFRTQKVERMKSDDAQAARRQLAEYEKKAGGAINSQTLPMLEQQITNKKVPISQRELDQIKRLVNRAEGNE